MIKTFTIFEMYLGKRISKIHVSYGLAILLTIFKIVIQILIN